VSDHWITFDCFGTLVDWHTGFANAVGPYAGARTAELLSAYHEFEAPLEAERPHRLYRDVLTTGLLRAAQKIGLPFSEAQARKLPETWDALPIFADVEPMLSNLRAGGWKLAVLTNCDEDLFAQTQRNFRQPFDLVITAERVRDYKPSASHFRYFSRTTGVNHANWVHVACSWFHDIAPARELGIKRIWLDRDHTPDAASAATAHIPSADQVIETVERIMA